MQHKENVNNIRGAGVGCEKRGANGAGATCEIAPHLQPPHGAFLACKKMGSVAHVLCKTNRVTAAGWQSPQWGVPVREHLSLRAVGGISEEVFNDLPRWDFVLVDLNSESHFSQSKLRRLALA